MIDLVYARNLVAYQSSLYYMSIRSFDSFTRIAADDDACLSVLIVRARERASDHPIATIWVERIETQTDSPGTGVRHLTLNYVLIAPDRTDSLSGSFAAEYRPFDGSLSLACGAVFLDLPRFEGQRIGTYLMYEIVTWAKQWPDADIVPIKLKHDQGRDRVSRTRRNAFYENIGLIFDYDNPEQTSGRSRPITASQLTQVTTWQKNISIKEPLAFLEHQALTISENIREKQRLSNAYNWAREREKTAEAAPLQWAIKQHLFNKTFQYACLTVIAIVLLAITLI